MQSKNQRESWNGRQTQTESQIAKKAIGRIVRQNFKKKRMESAVLILSVTLVTILMTVMFGAGISLLKNLELANLRVKGTTANVIVPHPEGTEMKQFAGIEEISGTGWQQFVATALLQEEKSCGAVYVMTAYDETEWETHIVPTLSEIEGTYPKDEKEIMMSRQMLGQLGIEEPDIGMEIPLSFRTLDGEEKTQTFILSGYYVDYINYAPNITPNSGNTISANLYYAEKGSTKKAVGNMAVSQEFARRYGTQEGLYGTAAIDGRLNTEEAFAVIDEVTDRQDIMVMGLSKTLAQSLSMAAIPILSVILIMIAGYLLIYNVINISVIQEMHMFGQLKTLGATNGQLKSMVRMRSGLAAGIGIPAGLLIGTVFAESVVPGLLKRMTEGNGLGTAFETDVAISPWIYVFAIVFAYLTVAFGNRKPSKMAAQVPPVEALKYVGQTETIKAHRGGSGGKLYRMAYRNVFRSKKKAMVTFVSLFFGFLMFLIVGVCTYGVDYEERYAREQPDSFTLRNLTFQSTDAGDIEDLLNASVTDTIEAWEGVEEITFDYVRPAYLRSKDSFLEPYIRLQAEYMGMSGEQIRERLRARSIGLPLEKFQDFSYESTLPETEIWERLTDGTGVFLAEYAEVDMRQICGKKIMLSDRIRDGGDEKDAEYIILGIVGSKGKNYVNDPYYYGEVTDDDIPLYMTTEGLERLWKDMTPEASEKLSEEQTEGALEQLEGVQTAEEAVRLPGKPRVQTLRIQTDGSRDEEILGELEKMFAGAAAIQMDSQIETGEMADRAFSTFRTIGNLFAAFLIFMGMINFLNVIFTNIYARRKELAALESIGMTRKQMKKVLMLEGVCYSGITMLLLCTIGVGIACAASWLFKTAVLYFARFGIPVANLCIVFTLMISISGSAPVAVYHHLSKESVVERLRKNQD